MEIHLTNLKPKNYENVQTQRFITLKTIKVGNYISDAVLHINFCLLVLNELKIKKEHNLKLYKFLLILSGDISLNPRPSHNTPVTDNKFEPFNKRGLHVLHINVNRLLSKIDELRDIVSKTKPAILGITESKLDKKVNDQDINISGYNILRSDRNRNSGGVACYVRSDLCFNRKNIFSNSLEHAFFDILIPKVKPVSIGIFYRPPNVNNFLETFSNDLKQINFNKNKVYILGDFNINILQNNNFILKENRSVQLRNSYSPFITKYKEMCQ